MQAVGRTIQVSDEVSVNSVVTKKKVLKGCMFINSMLKVFECRAKYSAVDCLVTVAVLGKREPFLEFLEVMVHW